MSKVPKNLGAKVDSEATSKSLPESSSKKGSFLRRGSKSNKEPKSNGLSAMIDPKAKKEQTQLKKGFSRLLTPKYYEIKAMALSKVEEKKIPNEHVPMLSDKKKIKQNSAAAKESTSFNTDKVETPKLSDIKIIKATEIKNKKEQTNNFPAGLLLQRNAPKDNNQSSFPIIEVSDAIVSTPSALSPNNISSASQLTELISSRSPSPTQENDTSPAGAGLSSSTYLNSSANSILFHKSIASTLGTGSSISINSVSTMNVPKGWEKVYQFFTGWVGKNKRTVAYQKSPIEKRGKRLNATRLKVIKKRIEDSRKTFLDHTEENFINYAPLYTLKLVSLIFSEEATRIRLESESKMIWGIRKKNWVDYVEIDAPWENQCGKRMIGQPLKPSDYISRVVKECWKAILKIGRGPSNKEEASKKAERRRGLWFLKQFCIIYGFGVIKLGVCSVHMLPQLEMIATFPEFLPIQNFIEDTIYGLEKQDSLRGKHLRRVPSYVIRANTPIRRTTTSNYQLYQRVSSNPIKHSPLSPTHISSGSNSQGHGQGLQAQEGSGITLERLILYLMEGLTKVTSPVLSTKMFSQLIQEVPKGPSIVDNFHRGEINLCCDYLMSYDFVVSPNRWFRESCDQQELNTLSQVGLVSYLDSTKFTVSQGALRAKNLSKGSFNLQEEAKLDPRLVASHLKHVISQHGGLISAPVACTVIELISPTPIRAKSHPNVINQKEEGSNNGDILQSEEKRQFLRSLFLLSPFQFNLLQRIIQVSQRILKFYKPSPNFPFQPAMDILPSSENGEQSSTLTPQELAIVLPVIPAHLLSGVQLIKQWNFIWGKLIADGESLFLDPTLNGLSLIPNRLSKGFQFSLEILQASGIKFLS